MCIWKKNKSAETPFLSILERFWDVSSPFSVDFLQKVSVLHGFPPCLTNTRKFSENRKFHKKNTKIRWNSRKFEFFFIFFRKSRFFLQRNLKRNWQKQISKTFQKNFKKIQKKQVTFLHKQIICVRKSIAFLMRSGKYNTF